MASIKIATGVKVYDIEDENGNVRGQISFNPSDMAFFGRAKETEKIINQIVEEAKLISNDTEDEIVKKLENFDKRIKSAINILFDDENASRVVFGNQSSLNTLKGVTFVERFLQAFVPIIEKEFANETKKSKERISKYTKGIK